MRKFSLVVSVPVISAAIASLVACTAPVIPNDYRSQDRVIEEEPTKDAGAGKGKGTKDAGAAKPSNPSTPSDPRDPAPNENPAQTPKGTGACATSATKQACFVCCETAHPQALPILEVEWDKCACQTPGKCKAACATTYCANPPRPGAQGDACDVCLTGIGAECATQVDAACIANPSCNPLYKCDDDALCSTKP